MGYIEPLTDHGGIAAYAGHNFYYAEVGSPEPFLSFVIKNDTIVYPVTCPDSPPDRLKAHEEELAFMTDYVKRTGRVWVSTYERSHKPPRYFMWDTSVQHRYIDSVHGKWHCAGEAAQCHDAATKIKITTLAHVPRLFEIRNFLSPWEAQHIIGLGKGRISQSMTGMGRNAKVDPTRTSKNTWVKREDTPIVETIFRRVADALNFPEQDLWPHRSAESLQLVHYQDGERYDAHFDWSGIDTDMRFVTFLIYLNDMATPTSGGETELPMAEPIAHPGTRGAKLHPGAGSVIFFYDMLEDGNGDDRALHASLPKTAGEKWLCNLWVWDPKFKDASKWPEPPAVVSIPFTSEGELDASTHAKHAVPHDGEHVAKLKAPSVKNYQARPSDKANSEELELQVATTREENRKLRLEMQALLTDVKQLQKAVASKPSAPADMSRAMYAIAGGLFAVLGVSFAYFAVCGGGRQKRRRIL